MTQLTGKVIDYVAGGAPGKLFLPKDHYTSGKKYPLIIDFSGSGELSAATVLNQGIGKKLAGGWDGSVTMPDGSVANFIVFIPIADQSWAPLDDLYLKDLITNFNVDPNRMHLSGLSQGGTDLMKWVGEQNGSIYATKFAGCLVLSPGGADITDDQYSKMGTHTKYWFWVGDQDKTCPRFYDDNYITGIEKYNPGSTKLTVVPGAGHDVGVWDKAYDTTGTTPDKNALMWLAGLTLGAVAPVNPIPPLPVRNIEAVVTIKDGRKVTVYDNGDTSIA